MHGVDWPAMRRTYEVLLPHVNHRADLTYVIGEMIGELNAGHAYVGGGDLPRLERTPMGLLGAQLQRDPQSKYFRITKIFKGQNWDPSLRSPLTEIGVDASVGDYILEVDGRSTAGMTDIWEALVGKAGKQVSLRINAVPSLQGSRETIVIPVEDERGLYYFDWVQGNIEKVSRASLGRVGYLHVPDMGVPGLNEFAKYFYAQTDKDAMIIDVRSNGGGNVSPMIIERLRRELVLVDIARNGAPNANPGAMVLGPKVLLADEFSASDGDLGHVPLQGLQDGPGRRQADLGRRRRHPRRAADARRRGAQPAGVLPLRRRGQDLGDRGRRRRAGHLRRQRPGEGVRRRGPAARQGHRGHPRPAEEEPGEAAASAAAARQAVMSAWTTPVTKGSPG